MSWMPNFIGKSQTPQTQAPQTTTKVDSPESSSLGQTKPTISESQPPSHQTSSEQPKTQRTHPLSFMFREEQQPHEYEVKTTLGSVKDYPPEVVQGKLSHHMTPFQSPSKPVKNGQETAIPGLGTVKHEVHKDGSITNQTTPNHLLHDGMVNRSVKVEDGQTVVVTHGSGKGPLPRVNNLLANTLWGSMVDSGLKQDVDQSMGRGKPPSNFDPMKFLL